MRILIDNALTHTPSGHPDRGHRRTRTTATSGWPCATTARASTPAPRADLRAVLHRRRRPGLGPRAWRSPRELAERMAGRLTVASEPGDTMFTLELPVVTRGYAPRVRRAAIGERARRHRRHGSSLSWLELAIARAGAARARLARRAGAARATGRAATSRSRSTSSPSERSREFLAERAPAAGLLLRGPRPGRAADDATDVLVVDPIDGTRPAMAGLESACVAVALAPLGDGEPTMADVRAGLRGRDQVRRLVPGRARATGVRSRRGRGAQRRRPTSGRCSGATASAGARRGRRSRCWRADRRLVGRRRHVRARLAGVRR